jgi:hypothetical protein
MNSPRKQFGAVPRPVIGVVVALVIGGYMALRLYRSGASNLSYIIAMSVAAIVVAALVAPKLLSGEQRKPGDWSKEVKDLKASRGDLRQPEKTQDPSEG